MLSWFLIILLKSTRSEMIYPVSFLTFVICINFFFLASLPGWLWILLGVFFPQRTTFLFHWFFSKTFLLKSERIKQVSQKSLLVKRSARKLAVLCSVGKHLPFLHFLPLERKSISFSSLNLIPQPLFQNRKRSGRTYKCWTSSLGHISYLSPLMSP